jgi:hypothetical protein
VARLIEQLGHAEFRKREEASKELEAIGEPAFEALRKAAASSDDVEIRRRAEQIIGAIADRACKKELARWEGHWESEEKSWFKFTRDRWASGTPTWGPVSGTVRVRELRGKIALADLAVEEGPTKGQTCKAIFRLDGDVLHYCGTYTADYATEFKTEGNYYSGSFKRVKK